MSSYELIQGNQDTHQLSRISIVRFVVLDCTIHSSLKSLASYCYKQGISINLENPYSIDIDQEAINAALDRLRFSSIHWNNFFSKDDLLVVDPEEEKLEEFLAHYFDVPRPFLGSIHTHVKPTETAKPMEMIAVSSDIANETMVIEIKFVTDRDPIAKITVKNGRQKIEEEELFVERVVDVNDNVDYYLYSNESEMQRFKIAKAYLDYRTDLFLQEVLSFFIRYPEKIYELVSLNTDDSIKAEFDLTTIIENLTSSTPPYGRVKLLLKIFRAMASPLSITDETDIWGKLIPQKTARDLNPAGTGLPFPPQEIIEVAHSAGLTAIRSELSDLLAVDLAEGMDIFEDIIDICSSLFNGDMSEVMRFIDSQLPTLITRFQTMQATPLQQDHFFRASDVVTEILNNAISRERISDLHAVSSNRKSTNITVNFFRSLYDLAKSIKSSHISKVSINQRWADSAWYVLHNSNRLDFLHFIWWMISGDT